MKYDAQLSGKSASGRKSDSPRAKVGIPQEKLRAALNRGPARSGMRINPGVPPVNSAWNGLQPTGDLARRALCSAALEVLEGRDLMSGTIGLDAGTLILSADGAAATRMSVHATNGGKDLVAHVSGSRTERFASSAVSKIELLSGTGNDFLRVARNVKTPALLNGGAGNNTLVGGGGNDTLIAGNGNNRVLGGRGNDSISVGNGTNVVHAGSGNDMVQSGNGDNQLYADQGNDTLIAGNGRDVLHGGSGHDSLVGGGGRDVIIGGAGMNMIVAGTGKTTVRDERGPGTVVRGPETRLRVGRRVQVENAPTMPTAGAPSGGGGSGVWSGGSKSTTGNAPSGAKNGRKIPTVGSSAGSGNTGTPTGSTGGSTSNGSSGATSGDGSGSSTGNTGSASGATGSSTGGSSTSGNGSTTGATGGSGSSTDAAGGPGSSTGGAGSSTGSSGSSTGGAGSSTGSGGSSTGGAGSSTGGSGSSTGGSGSSTGGSGSSTGGSGSSTGGSGSSTGGSGSSTGGSGSSTGGSGSSTGGSGSSTGGSGSSTGGSGSSTGGSGSSTGGSGSSTGGSGSSTGGSGSSTGGSGSSTGGSGSSTGGTTSNEPAWSNQNTLGSVDPGTVDTTGPVTTANIQVMEPNGMATHTVHFNGLGSVFASGDALDARYTWDYGDTGSRFNTTTGWIGAHTFDTPGQYTVTLTVTDKSGNSATASTTVNIAPDTRTVIYVDSQNGNDSNSGLSPTTAIATAARAHQLMTDNSEILFHNGQEFQVSNTLAIVNSNVLVGTYGTGAKARLVKIAGSGSSIFNVTTKGTDFTAQGIEFDSIWTFANYGRQKTNARAFWVAGNNFTVRDCNFLNVDDGVSTAGMPTGVLVQDNYFGPEIRACCIWGQGYDHVYLGNTMTDSTQEHLIRTSGTGVCRLVIEDNNLSRVTPIKGTLELRTASFFNVIGNTVTRGNLRLGLPDGVDPYFTGWGVVQGNETYDLFANIRPGVQHVAIRDNMFNGMGGAFFRMETQGTAGDPEIVDFRIDHNTLVDSNPYAKFMTIDGQAQQISVTNNLFIAPNITWKGDGSGAIYVEGADLSDFSQISNNIWPALPASTMQIGENYLNPTWGQLTGFVSTANWSAFAQVHNEQYADETLPADVYDVSLNGTTAGAQPTVFDPTAWSVAAQAA